MKKFIVILLVFLFAAFGITTLTAAQEVTEVPTVVPTDAPTPPPVEQSEPIPGTDYGLVQIVIIGLAVLLLGVIAVFGVTIVQLSRNALNSLPPWMIDRIRANAPPLLDQLDLLTDVPGTQLDDQARAEIRRLLGEILAENAQRAQAARAFSGKE